MRTRAHATQTIGAIWFVAFVAIAVLAPRQLAHWLVLLSLAIALSAYVLVKRRD